MSIFRDDLIAQIDELLNNKHEEYVPFVTNEQAMINTFQDIEKDIEKIEKGLRGLRKTAKWFRFIVKYGKEQESELLRKNDNVGRLKKGETI